MKDKANIIIISTIIIILAVVSSLAMTLRGDTFTQNRLGTDSCSFAQTKFSDLASPFQYQTEFMAVAVLFRTHSLFSLACYFLTIIKALIVLIIIME